jgi:hypothetical protein
MARASTAWALAAAAAVLVPAARAEDPAVEKPFPVDRTQILSKEKSVYTVEGRVRIPKGVEVSVLKEILVKAKGSTPAVIEVEGSLTVHGVFGREVIFEDVTVEPATRFTQITMDMTIFRGSSGGVKTAPDKPAEGPLQLELFDFIGGAAMDVCFSAGSITLSSVCAASPTKVLVKKAPGKESSLLRFFIRGCPQNPVVKCTPHGGRVGLVGGLEADGGDDMTIQLSRIGGSLCAVRNWGQRLIFDGLKINSDRVELTHEKAGQFQRVQCAKLDIYSESVLASAPAVKGVKDTLTMDRCWFKGVTDPKVVREKILKDGSAEPEKNGVRIQLPKINDRPLELAGPVER